MLFVEFHRGFGERSAFATDVKQIDIATLAGQGEHLAGETLAAEIDVEAITVALHHLLVGQQVGQVLD